MPKTVLLAAALLSISLSGCATIHVVERGRYEVVTLDTLVAEGERLAPQLMGEGVVVRLEKGREVPLDFVLRSPLLTAQSAAGTVTVEQDLYLLISEKGLMLSPDGERFAPLQSQRGLKKLFGLRGGQFAMGFGATRDEGAKVTVRVEAR